jgi:hypothetical protein
MADADRVHVVEEPEVTDDQKTQFATDGVPDKGGQAPVDAESAAFE